MLGNLCSDQGKLAEAEEMYQRALKGYEKALGAEHNTRGYTRGYTRYQGYISIRAEHCIRPIISKQVSFKVGVIKSRLYFKVDGTI